MAITIYELKPRFQGLLRPLVRRLAAAGVTANQVTRAGDARVARRSVRSSGCAPRRVWPFLLLPLWLFLRMALNAIDGMLAREFGQQSALGAYLNELTDVVSDAALYLPFALLAPFGADVGRTRDRARRAVRNGRRARADGRRAAPLRRADGQERSRVRVRRARRCMSGLGGPLSADAYWLMPVISRADRGQHREPRAPRRGAKRSAARGKP